MLLLIYMQKETFMWYLMCSQVLLNILEIFSGFQAVEVINVVSCEMQLP